MSTTSIDPGDRSARELEREVDQERARVAETIDALQEKVSVNNMVDQVVAAVKEHGGPVSRNLGRTMRDNPLPVILTAVGLAWLMSSTSSPSGRRDRYDPYDDDWDRDYVDRDYVNRSYVDRSGLSTYPATDYPASDYDESVSGSAFGAASTPYAGGVDEGTSTYGETSSYGEKNSPSVTERFNQASGSVKERASALLEGGRDRASQAREGLHSAGDRAREGLRSASDRARSAAEDARYRARRGGEAARDNFDTMLQEQPLVLGALALALGAAFGSALPRTRTEDELMGEQADRLKEQLSTAARENAEKVRAVGAAVADEALSMADEAAGEVDKRMPEGSAMAENAKSAAEQAAERLRRRAEDEAQRQGLTSGSSSGTGGTSDTTSSGTSGTSSSTT